MSSDVLFLDWAVRQFTPEQRRLLLSAPYAGSKDSFVELARTLDLRNADGDLSWHRAWNLSSRFHRCLSEEMQWLLDIDGSDAEWDALAEAAQVVNSAGRPDPDRVRRAAVLSSERKLTAGEGCTELAAAEPLAEALNTASTVGADIGETLALVLRPARGTVGRLYGDILLGLA